MSAQNGQVKEFISILKQICQVSQPINEETILKVHDILTEFPETNQFLENNAENITLTRAEFLILKEQLEEIIFMAGHLAYTSVALLRNKFEIIGERDMEEIIENIPSPSKFNN